MAFEMIVKKKKEIIKIYEMKFISKGVNKGQFEFVLDAIDVKPHQKAQSPTTIV